MSILTKASTVTTPTAYSKIKAASNQFEGRLHSVKPIDARGSELVTNGTFDTDSDWTKGTGWSISGGKADRSGVVINDYIGQSVIVEAGKKYIISYDRTYISGFGQTNLYSYFINSGSRTTLGNYVDTTQETVTVTDTFTPTFSGDIDLRIYGINDFTGSIDNVTIKEDTSADFDFVRASSATRVNEQGYIEDVPYNLVQQSNTFDTTWINYLTTETGGQADKDGGTSAWQIDKTGASGSIYQTAVIRGVQTFSVYAKKGTLDWVRLTFLGTSNAFFDLANGVVGSTTGALAVSSDIVSIGDGWYRINFVSDNVSTTGVSIIPAESDGVISGTSGNIYIQDAQLVKGSDAKDYLETTDRQDIPRINYENGIGNFLLEPQRTNLVTYSEDFENGWSLQTGIDVSGNEATSPDGNTNATKIETSSAGARYVGNNYTLATGDNTFSVFAKKGTTNWIYLNVYQDASNNWNFTFDLGNGLLGQSNSSAYTVTASIEDYGDGWYRITAKANITSSGTYTARIYPADSATDVSTDIGDSVYIYGAQVEAASYPTSYIPTYGSAVTRAAETCNNAGNSDLFNDSEGVLYAELSWFEISTNIYLSLSDGTNSNRILFYSTDEENIRGLIQDGGATQASFNIAGQNARIFNKVALKYKANDVAFWINGVKVGTDTTATIPSGLNAISFNGGASASFHGKTKMVSTFTEALSDSELECLTSWSSFNRMATAQNYTIE